MDVLSLLEYKNQCLEKFLEFSSEFLAHAESGELSSLETFQLRRESALKIIEFCDRRLSEAATLLPQEERTAELVRKVETKLRAKDDLLQKILGIDDKILIKLDEEKRRILKEVSVNGRRKETVSKFKSTWVADSGEELDAKL